MTRPTDVELVKLLRRASANAEHLMNGANEASEMAWRKASWEYKDAADALEKSIPKVPTRRRPAAAQEEK